MSTKQYVRDLKDKDQVESIFLVTEKSSLTDRNGKLYLSITLSDSTGHFNGRIWEKADEIQKRFESGDFVKVRGFVQTYQNRKQLIVHDCNKVLSNEVNLSDYIGVSQLDPIKMYDQLLDLVLGIQNDFIRGLMHSTLIDEEIKVRLLKAPAAKTIHHAYIGGLLEHILSICELMKSVAHNYKWLNLDLLIFGAVFHDIGKLWELSIEDGIKYTDRGRLVGHMAIGCELIDEKSRSIFGFPVALKESLKHIVLAHHGKLEYGSPKEPAFPEAMVVAMIDDLDSRMNTIFHFMKSELSGGENWTRFNTQFERYFYLPFLRDKLETPSEG